MKCWQVCVLGCVLSAGCASQRLASSGAGLPSRHIVRSGPYTFTTDFPIKPEDPVVRSLLSLRERVEKILPSVPSRDPLRVVIFDTPQRYYEFLRINYPDWPIRRALFLKQATGEAVVYTFKGPRLLEDLRHEATHDLLHRSVPTIPLWLDEGLAEYFETDDSPASTDIERPRKLAERLSAGKSLDLLRLETIRDEWQLSEDDYRECWLWVHYLLGSGPANREKFLAYLRELPKNSQATLSSKLGDLTLQNEMVKKHLDALNR